MRRMGAKAAAGGAATRTERASSSRLRKRTPAWLRWVPAEEMASNQIVSANSLSSARNAVAMASVTIIQAIKASGALAADVAMM